MVCITAALRQILAAGDRSIDNVAGAAGLPRSVLYKFLKGDTLLDGESLDRLAECLRVKLQQVIYWDEYVRDLRSSNQLVEAWKKSKSVPWEEYEKDFWHKHVADAWANYEPKAWNEIESKAWPKALASGKGVIDDDYCQWKAVAYQDWYAGAYPAWYKREYNWWNCENEILAWCCEEYDAWEVEYLKGVRKELADREYVVLVDTAR